MNGALMAKDNSGGATAAGTRACAIRRLGAVGFRQGWRLQLEAAAALKRGDAGDRLLFAEHPATITLGRNADGANILASPELLERRGIAVEETDRGGDVTFHGPGQIVGYPILDLKFWRRDVGAYLRNLESVMIGALGEFGIAAGRLDGCTGVWVGGAKIAAIGVHLSRWVTTHGFALNVSTNLDDFGLIVPCGIPKPVTSMQRVLRSAPPQERVVDALVRHFCLAFERVPVEAASRPVNSG